MSELRRLSPWEQSRLIETRVHWEDAYEVTFEMVEGRPKFIARYIGRGQPAKCDSSPVVADAIEVLRERMQNDYGLRPEFCGGSERRMLHGGHLQTGPTKSRA